MYKSVIAEQNIASDYSAPNMIAQHQYKEEEVECLSRSVSPPAPSLLDPLGLGLQSDEEEDESDAASSDSMSGSDSSADGITFDINPAGSQAPRRPATPTSPPPTWDFKILKNPKTARAKPKRKKGRRMSALYKCYVPMNRSAPSSSRDMAVLLSMGEDRSRAISSRSQRVTATIPRHHTRHSDSSPPSAGSRSTSQR